MAVNLEEKQREFNAAMARFNADRTYKRIARAVSTVNVALQVDLLIQVARLPIGFTAMATALVLAYLAADFISGVVHMYMDNNDSYDSLAGSWVAIFHLHHKKPVYKTKPLWKVWFDETGSKVWLVGYLVVVAVLLERWDVSPLVSHLLVYIGVLSSLAEVSHYLCHTSSGPLANFLGRIGVLLDKRRHARHHLGDNNNYATLNGWTNPLLNVIAQKTVPGYKNTTDLHFATYSGET
jgi:hypothetical protein